MYGYKRGGALSGENSHTILRIPSVSQILLGNSEWVPAALPARISSPCRTASSIQGCPPVTDVSSRSVSLFLTLRGILGWTNDRHFALPDEKPFIWRRPLRQKTNFFRRIDRFPKSSKGTVVVGTDAASLDEPPTDITPGCPAASFPVFRLSTFCRQAPGKGLTLDI